MAGCRPAGATGTGPGTFSLREPSLQDMQWNNGSSMQRRHTRPDCCKPAKPCNYASLVICTRDAAAKGRLDKDKDKMKGAKERKKAKTNAKRPRTNNRQPTDQTSRNKNVHADAHAKGADTTDRRQQTLSDANCNNRRQRAESSKHRDEAETVKDIAPRLISGRRRASPSETRRSQSAGLDGRNTRGTRSLYAHEGPRRVHRAYSLTCHQLPLTGAGAASSSPVCFPRRVRGNG